MQGDFDMEDILQQILAELQGVRTELKDVDNRLSRIEDKMETDKLELRSEIRNIY